MPAERINVSFEPRPLELLYSKYAPNKGVSSSTSTPFTQPNPSSLIKSKGTGKKLSRSDLPPGIGIPRRQELGDLKKLGRELTKMERVQMFFDMSNNVSKGKTKSRSQPNSAAVNLKCLNAACQQCSQERKQEDGQSKLKDLKSKLRLVAGRGVPADSSTKHSTASTSPVRHSGQHVVPLPLLHLNYKRHASSSEDFVALRDAKQSLRYMFYPQPFASRQAAAVWNYRFTNGNKYPQTREFLREYAREKAADSSDSSYTRLMPPAVVPACSPADDIYETKTTTTFDADRVDSEQFEYVFERFSAVSSSESWVSLLSAESDTATYSARAQRPSTADSVATPQRFVETRASMVPPLSPISPRQRTREGESWPPQYTVVPSWPSLDDPYRFQYFGCGLHRDIKRRLHKSRIKRRNSKQNRIDQPQPPPEPQKLKVVVPYYSECSVCNSFDCEHVKPPNTATMPSTTTSIAAKSAKSRDSLSLSVCTVLSRQTKPSQQSVAVPKIKDKGGLPRHTDLRDHSKGMALTRERGITYHRNDFDRK